MGMFGGGGMGGGGGGGSGKTTSSTSAANAGNGVTTNFGINGQDIWIVAGIAAVTTILIALIFGLRK